MQTSDITIGLSQLPIVKAAVAENLATHLKYIKRAAAMGADVVVFPELSLTGYELELLEQLAMPKSADTFIALSAAATANNIVIIAGFPLISEGNKPQIGAVICFPSGQRDFYAKQHLHKGEDIYCSAGSDSYLLTVNGIRIALAICADFANPAHAEAAAAQQADVYIASALISKAGYEADTQLLAGIAKRHQFPVLLSNHISLTGGWQTCGKSGGWKASGELVISAEGSDPTIVLCHVSQGALTQKKIDSR
ncbi:MAG: carbon-nitrogen hydrolase family protein [Halomonadaceae bacterium]|uniref:Carbon-nitrogen hydrolase family protein n=1 Tax=Halomonas colorata TaxID=2742615 RepID=A0ABR9FZ09_9GAMM|nr:carbon-nitrogen hydrolase family protein [Halomonas colorata]MBE0463871.1 carbon-nitrogen hydrolase family protein [Halomonas colorata]